MLVDTHCHIFSEYYDDIDNVVDECLNNNTKVLINAGVDKKTSLEVIELCKKYDCMYGCIGIHPEAADEYTEDDLSFIECNISNNKIVAIGEIGLDYHYENYNKEKQIELFESQLEIAQKYDIPVVVHSREATKDTVDILKKYNVRGVIHSFSGSYEIACEYLKMGFKLGVNGVITFKNCNIKDVYEKIGVDNILLETDSPYLTPVPFRGKKNYPYNVAVVADFLKNYFSLDDGIIEKITNDNVIAIFDKVKL